MDNLAVGSTGPAERRLRDLRTTDGPVLVLGRVVSVQRREVTRRSDGERRPVLSGLLSDGTATVRFTWWDPPAEGVERGTVLRAANVQVREYRGRPEISFNWRTRVEPASEVELPQLAPEDLPLRQLLDLAPTDEGFRIDARVVRISSKTVSVGQEQRVVHEGLLADGTTTVAFSSWSDFGLSAGEAVRISAAYVRSFRGRPQLVMDDRSSVERIEGTGLPTPDVLLDVAPRSVAALEAEGGGESVATAGVVVALLPPSGLVYRCPTCRRTVTKGLCRVHGIVESQPDLRARLVLDDGTGALTVNMGRPETERIWGRTLADCLQKLREQPDPSALEEQLFEAVFGQRLRVRGRATKDDFGLTLYPEVVEKLTPDSRESVDGLLQRLQGRT